LSPEDLYIATHQPLPASFSLKMAIAVHSNVQTAPTHDQLNSETEYTQVLHYPLLLSRHVYCGSDRRIALTQMGCAI
jgi:hypothetical protein